jgi:hypothetical protein
MACFTAQANLLTYQLAIPIGDFQALPFWENVKEYSWCTERANRVHTHLYVVLKEKPNHVDFDVFDIGEHHPNVSACAGRGRSARRSWDRAHFYVFNPWKTSHVDSTANYRPLRDYHVDASWILTLWRQNKLDNPVDCAATYRVLTPHIEAQVSLVTARQDEIDRKAALKRRAAQLEGKKQAFEDYPQVEEWKESFEEVQHRYKFLWISGPSGLGKTVFAQNLGKHTYMHAAGIDWAAYNPNEHDTVVFDDIYDMETYINMHKPMFQASRATAINTSRTNCHVRRIDTAGKKLIVCSNDAPTTAWVCANCIHLEVTAPMFTTHKRLCNYGEFDDE